MKKCIPLFLFFISIFFYGEQIVARSVSNTIFSCNRQTIPRVIKAIENYNIVAYNTASISAASAFGGEKLIYSAVSRPKNKKNVVTISSYTGKIHIQANAQDQFDIKVIAKNACGSASTTFNVEIDEDKG